MVCCCEQHHKVQRGVFSSVDRTVEQPTINPMRERAQTAALSKENGNEKSMLLSHLQHSDSGEISAAGKKLSKLQCICNSLAPETCAQLREF